MLKRQPILQAITAALLFGASAPLAKILLGTLDPILLAGFLYLGSGLGGLLLHFLNRDARSKTSEAHLIKSDIPWMAGAVIAGGIIAPIVLMTSLKTTPAATASLLLNFESIATTLIAALAFKEAIGRRVIFSVIMVTLASILLSWNTNGNWGFSIGALGIMAACLLWGLDNNFTRKISNKNPLTIVIIKGLGAGIFSISLGILLNRPVPDIKSILLAMLLGAFSYGLSIYLFIHSMRNLGAARASILFGSAPFVGAALSLILIVEAPSPFFWYSIPLMLIGAWLMLTEDHRHIHTHQPFSHEHRHYHPNDDHHQHEHQLLPAKRSMAHSHWHVHTVFSHEHAHTPDVHHAHSH